MKPLLLVLLAVPAAMCQTATESGPGDSVQPAQPAQSNAIQQPRTILGVTPGAPVIKQKDLWDQTGYFHPFVRMPKYILQDQEAIWTSPFHTRKSDLKYWAIFGGAVAALIATDDRTMKEIPTSTTSVSVSTWASRFGSSYSLIPISAGFYFLGSKAHNDRLRETGLLCFETLIDSNLVVQGIKLAADRARPLEADGNGHFEAGANGRWYSSFPSGHAINTWGMASVVAHEYPHPRIIPILAYAFASTVVVARVGAQRHFPGDVAAGSALGWFIGDYVFGRRHNTDLDSKPSAAQKLLNHVRVGVAME